MDNEPKNQSDLDKFIEKAEEQRKRHATIESMKNKLDTILQKKLDKFYALPVEKRIREFGKFKKEMIKKLDQFRDKVNLIIGPLPSAEEFANRSKRINMLIQEMKENFILEDDQATTEAEPFTSIEKCEQNSKEVDEEQAGLERRQTVFRKVQKCDLNKVSTLSEVLKLLKAQGEGLEELLEFEVMDQSKEEATRAAIKANFEAQFVIKRRLQKIQENGSNNSI